MRRLAFFAALALIAACDGPSYLTSPSPEPASRGITPTNVLLTSTPERLPASGGTADILIKVVARNTSTGDVGVPNVAVKIESTTGELDVAQFVTNDAGEGRVRWTTTKTGTVVARHSVPGCCEINGAITIALDGGPVPPPAGPPSPAPPAPPGPPPPGEPALLVNILVGFGDQDVLTPINFASVVSISSGEPAAVSSYAWDFDSDGTIDSRVSAPSHIFTRSGAHTVTLDVTANGLAGRASRTMFIGGAPPPGVAVSLVATPSTVMIGDTVTLTATATPSKTTGAVTGYDWDFDGNGSVDRTTTVATTMTTYPAAGTQTALVSARTLDGLSGTASASITVNTPPPPPPPTLTLSLAADSTSINTGATVTFTTTVGGLASGETIDEIEWDFDANGTRDAFRVGDVGAPLPFTYSTPGRFDAKVTLKTITGRTKSATRQITVVTP